jgi:diadenosine tetraphosphate (Ap4A) HIT family hydrolase
MNDQRYPWVILVPKVPGVAEIHELADEQQHLLMSESIRLSKALDQLYSPHKLNIAALGNVVRQLHVHHVVRFEDDAVFPSPVWGVGTVQPYGSDELAETVSALTIAFDLL